MGIPVHLRMQCDLLLCEKPLLCMQEGSFDAHLLFCVQVYRRRMKKGDEE